MRNGKDASVVSGTLLLICLGSSAVRADDTPSGVSPQVITLPKGPGSIQGLGESFKTQLNTGTFSYTVPIQTPPGRAGLAPEIRLTYSSSGGYGPLGLGWSIDGLYYVQRKTENGVPLYTDQDTMISSWSNEDLVWVGEDFYRSKNEGAFIRFRKVPLGARDFWWEARTKSGLLYELGSSAASRVGDPLRTFKWLVERASDTSGNQIRYQYLHDGGQAYIQEIKYNFLGNNYQNITFEYEDRPDALTEYRSQAPIRTAKRLRRVDVASWLGGMRTLVRTYILTYATAPGSAISLLVGLRETGKNGPDDLSQSNALPPLTFGYTQISFASVGHVVMSNAPNLRLSNADVSQIDINADGLPDLVYTPEARPHEFYINRGRGRWDLGNPYLPAQNPPVRLSSSGAKLADFDGDGRADLIYKTEAPIQQFLNYRNRVELGFDVQPVQFTNPSFSFASSNVRRFDANADKCVDIVATEMIEYRFWLNPCAGDRPWSIGPDFTTPPKASHGLLLQFSNSRVKLADMNGDHMQDLVLVHGTGIAYFPNTGQGFGDQVEMRNPPNLSDSFLQKLVFGDFNGDGLTDVALPLSGSVQIWLNQGDQFTYDPIIVPNAPILDDRTVVTAVDVDGDGMDELQYNMPVGGGWEYLDFDNGIRPNLLQTIDNGMGRIDRVVYRSSTEYYVDDWDNGDQWTTRAPFPVTVVDQTSTEDLNSGQIYVTQNRYRSSYYDGRQHTFRGFQNAYQKEIGDSTAPTLVTKMQFDVGREEESRKGLVLRQDLLVDDAVAQCPSDPTGKCTLGAANGCFRCEQYSLETRTLAIGPDTGRVSFSFTKQKDAYLFEGSGPGKQLEEVYDRDAYGNITQEFKYGAVDGGDPSVGNDELLIYTDYAYNTGSWLLDRPKHIKKTDLLGNIVAEQELYYDGPAWTGLPYGSIDGGLLMRREERLGPAGSGGHPCPDAQTQRCIDTLRHSYDVFGNVTGSMDGDGDPAQLRRGHYRTIVFDSAFSASPIEEHIHLEAGSELLAQAAYDYSLGFLTDYYDFNNQRSQFISDPLGRLLKIVKPGDTPALPTLQYTYRLESPVSFIETNQREQSGQNGTVDSRMYFDGLGRKLQTKLRAEDGRFVVREGVTFNQRTKVRENYLPYFAAESIFDYRPVELSQSKMTVSYDALQREIQTIQPDGSFSQTVYAPLQKTAFDEENTDSASVHYNQPKTFTQDGLERLVQVDEQNGNQVYSTTYGYDALGRLTQIIDAEGNPTSHLYDWLGRRVEARHPDRGITRFTYFDTGFLQTSTDARAQLIRYTHDGANRIKTEVFEVPGSPAQTHAIYHYDDDRPTGLPPDHPTISNTSGRLVYVDDLSGQSIFSYDPRGHVAASTKKAGNANAFYTTQFSYDAADRLSVLTYPDPSLPPEQRFRISHQYNRRGLLGSIPNFASQIAYQASGQTASVLYANAALTTKTYDIRNRLDVLRTTSPSEAPSIIQDLKYDYDRTTNVLSITDRRPGAIGENNGSECFGYDDLYRLLRVDGRCQERAYYIAFAYSPSGNLTYKASNRAEVNIGSLRYGEQAGPHAVTTVGSRRFRYDGNGNLSGEDGAASYEWDPLDRLLRVVRNAGPVTEFAYDYTGARVTKRTSGEEVFYINSYSEVRNGHLIKYIFAGNHRLAEVDDSGQVTFNHFDHLGSSNMVTGPDARITARTEYYAFGQERLRSGTFRLPYSYTDKERDGSTGLSYFSARYYLSELGRFASPDPRHLQESVLSNPQDLNPYSYALNNPILHVDTDGQSATLAGALIGGLVGGGIALVQGKSWAEVGAAAAGGALAGAMLGSVIDTGGASLGVMIVAGGISGAAGGTLERTILGRPTTVQNLAVDALSGAAGVAGGALVGRAVTRAIEQEAVGSVVGKIHGNSKASLKPQHRYEIVHNKSGDVVKTGISGQSLNANGTSPRANRQVSALNRVEGPGTYSARVMETDLPGRMAGLKAERAATNQLKAEGNSLRLQVRPKPE